MVRFFNVSGPCDPARHYMVPSEARLRGVERLLETQAYFVVHAQRQVGKTTTTRAWARRLTASGRWTSAVLSLETGAGLPDDLGGAELAILDDWRGACVNQLPPDLQPPDWPEAPPGRRLGAALAAWATASSRPLVLFLDEVDALRDTVLISVLRQIRSGFASRPRGFPSSIGLVGMRDVRDYVVSGSAEGRLGSSSPFNVKEESLTLASFTRDEVAELYAQHTADTGQAFLPDALERAWALTRGQPWLVNALGRRLVEEVVVEHTRSITAADVETARRLLVARQDTHLDSLSERLREPRVRRIIEPMLSGDVLPDVPPDDLRFVCDLGLLRLEPDGRLEVANPLYREVIVRNLAATTQASLPVLTPRWLTAEGTLDPSALLDAFLSFWRQHGEPLLRSAPYHEVAPHLVLMAFLHRVVNGGGSVEREYAMGSGRMDVLVTHGATRLAVELKVWREGEADPTAAGLEQLDGDLAGLSLDHGWLVVFDRRSGQPRVAERTGAQEVQSRAGRRVVVVRA